MAKRIKYIGALDRYFELSVTGKQSVWGRGDTDLRDDAEADLLLATGLFVEDFSIGGTIPIITDPNLATNDNVLAAQTVKDYVAANAARGTVQNITRASAITAIDLSLGNIVNITDALPSGATLLAEPTMPADVQVGDRFEFFFNKILATQCTVQLPSTPSALSYTFNNGTQAHLAFEWSGTKLVEV